MGKRIGLSQAEAATRTGYSQPWISKLSREGWIEKESDGSLREASVLTVRERFGQRKGDSKKPANPDSNNKINKVDNKTDPDDLDGYDASMPEEWRDLSKADANTREARARAWKETIAAQKLAGEVIDRDEVAQKWEGICGTVREKMMAIPARAAMELGLTRDGKAKLDRMIRSALRDLGHVDSE